MLSILIDSSHQEVTEYFSSRFFNFFFHDLSSQKARREPLADDELNAMLARSPAELTQFRTLDAVNQSARVHIYSLSISLFFAFRFMNDDGWCVGGSECVERGAGVAAADEAERGRIGKVQIAARQARRRARRLQTDLWCAIFPSSAVIQQHRQQQQRNNNNIID